MKKIKFDLVLEVPAGQVTAGPPIATSLGPKGVPLGLFAKAINDLTSSYTKGATVRIRVKIFDDKSYDAHVMGYSTRYLILQKAGVSKGASKAGHETVATLSYDQIKQIAQDKFPNLDTEMAFRSIKGTARSMGIKVE